MKSGGLILGDILGKIFCCFLFIRFLNLEKNILRKLLKKKLKNHQRNSDFPKYAMPDQIISNLAGSIHIFFISAFFGARNLDLLPLSLLFFMFLLLFLARQ